MAIISEFPKFHQPSAAGKLLLMLLFDNKNVNKSFLGILALGKFIMDLWWKRTKEIVFCAGL